jgi:polyisoprenoid-binding protein YceI
MRSRSPQLAVMTLLAARLLTPAAVAGQVAAPHDIAPKLATFVLDTARSTLGFTITRPGETIEGKAPQFTGTIHADPDRPWAGASVELHVDPAAMQTGNSLRDRKMRNSHLEVTTYPDIVFESTEVAADPATGPADGRFVLAGRLRLHGVERPLRIPVTIGYHEGLLTADGDVAFTLSEFAIPIPRILWIVLDDKVTVRFHAVATRSE